MSTNVIGMDGRLLECAGRCGALVVGRLYCPSCQRLGMQVDAEFLQRRAAMKQRMLDGMARERAGIGEMPKYPEPEQSGLLVMQSEYPMLAVLKLAWVAGAVLVSWLLVYGLYCLGRMAIAWLCAHPL